MKQLADDLYILEGFPPYAINVYLLGEVLIDSSTRFAARRILHRLRGRTVTLHALTHAHPDHQGSSHAICEALGIPLWCSEGDADAMERPGEIMARMPKHWLSDTVGPIWTGPPHPVDPSAARGRSRRHLHGHRDTWAHGRTHLVLAGSRPRAGPR